MNFANELIKYAKSKKKTVVFPEVAFSDKTVNAVCYLKKHNICNVILVGDESSILMQHKKLKSFMIINPKTYSFREEFAKQLVYAMRDLTVTLDVALELINAPF